MLEGTLHFEAAVQCDTVDGHTSSEHSLPVSEVEEAGWLVAVAGEHTPSLPPLLQCNVAVQHYAFPSESGSVCKYTPCIVYIILRAVADIKLIPVSTESSTSTARNRQFVVTQQVRTVCSSALIYLYLDSLPVERRGLDKVAFLDRAGIHSQAPVHPRMRHAASRNIGLASGYADDNWSTSASHALGMIAICGLLQNNNIRRRCINTSICSHTLQTAVSQARLSQEEERGLTCEMKWQKSRG